MDWNYRRENYNRRKSEKVLDSFLFHAEKRETEKLQNELMFLKKRNEAIAMARKRRLEQSSNILLAPTKKFKEDATKDVDEVKHEVKEEIKGTRESAEEAKDDKEEKKPNKGRLVEPYAALVKIVKYIATANKYSKCLSMLKGLLSNHVEEIDSASVFTIIDLLCWSPYKFKLQQDAYTLKEIFTFILEFSLANSPYFSHNQELLIELYQIPAILHVQLFTDDSFQVCLL